MASILDSDTFIKNNLIKSQTPDQEWVAVNFVIFDSIIM